MQLDRARVGARAFDRALDEAEMHGAHDAIALDRRGSERAVVQLDGACAGIFGSEVEILEHAQQPRKRPGVLAGAGPADSRIGIRFVMGRCIRPIATCAAGAFHTVGRGGQRSRQLRDEVAPGTVGAVDHDSAVAQARAPATGGRHGKALDETRCDELVEMKTRGGDVHAEAVGDIVGAQAGRGRDEQVEYGTTPARRRKRALRHRIPGRHVLKVPCSG
jgi:hypothetical protein